MPKFLILAMKHTLTMAGAMSKVEKLEQLLNRHYPGWVPYDKRSTIVDVQTALAYIVNKKKMKAKRAGGRAAAATAFGAAGAAVGASAGTVVLPGAGSAVGAITVGNMVSATPGVGVQMYRKGKAAMKAIKGTLGKHRKEAAEVLYDATMVGNPNDKDYLPAGLAILVLLGDNDELFHAVMTDKNKKDAVKYIAKKMKSW
ncbi:MAG: hypothetical protein AAFX06_19795 [Planctomycetota bacterium]